MGYACGNGSSHLGDDWLTEPPREPRTGFPTTLTLRTLLLIGGGVVALLIVVVLLVAGVFTGGKAKPDTPATTAVNDHDADADDAHHAHRRSRACTNGDAEPGRVRPADEAAAASAREPRVQPRQGGRHVRARDRRRRCRSSSGR